MWDMRLLNTLIVEGVFGRMRALVGGAAGYVTGSGAWGRLHRRGGCQPDVDGSAGWASVYPSDQSVEGKAVVYPD